MDSTVKHYISNLQKYLFTKINEINTFEPNPNEQDYKNQYIIRFFIRKRNEQNGLIYEINKKTFDTIKNDNLYFGVSIKWKIYGDKNETETANKNSVNYGKKIISNLDTYINNYIKFWKG